METQSKATLAESLLTPDVQAIPPVPKPAPRPVLVFRSPVASSAKKQQRKRAAKRRTAGMYTVEQAFDYFYGPTSSDARTELNDERAIRAVAFLLSYCSEHGNQSIDGNAANGLARILELRATHSSAGGGRWSLSVPILQSI
jgi:hypothetical protein